MLPPRPFDANLTQKCEYGKNNTNERDPYHWSNRIKVVRSFHLKVSICNNSGPEPGAQCPALMLLFAAFEYPFAPSNIVVLATMQKFLYV